MTGEAVSLADASHPVGADSDDNMQLLNLQ